ncbi:unnamed protein product [Ceratitis capitata]|uniref:(Mediterranean fruit fly) hypothetical protein n=1 Tax=Ceratitis capitata TaxID=7213 RepID=A0A811VCG2_CERCA|nr:unnamed protein product [Ceratitis capitata]
MATTEEKFARALICSFYATAFINLSLLGLFRFTHFSSACSINQVLEMRAKFFASNLRHVTILIYTAKLSVIPRPPSLTRGPDKQANVFPG